MRKIYDDSKLLLIKNVEYLESPQNFDELLITIASKDWHVYAKEPFAGPEQVINYLGGYTHRIAISNYRILKFENNKVTFKVRNKENPEKIKTMTLEALEFLRRFLQHVLPKGLMRIRHFGILGNRHKKEKIALIKKLTNMIMALPKVVDLSWQELLAEVTGFDVNKCPKCEDGELHMIGEPQNMLNSS